MFTANRSRVYAAFRLTASVLAIFMLAAPAGFAQGGAAKAAVKKPGLTQPEVIKIWKLRDETLLLTQLRLKGLAFEPEEDWINQLPQLTGVPLHDMPRATAELRSRIPAAPDLETVTAAAPALLDKAKAAAQQRDAKAMESLLHPELLKAKSLVYDLFDTANYRGHSLGRFAAASNRQVSVQFFQLTASQVERVHYVYFSVLRGKVVIRDVKSGKDVAAHFLRDEQDLAQRKLEQMFRALNDGDDAGVKLLCTDGLYQAIRDWGGDKHPGDRLTRGRKLDQVSAVTSVDAEHKSVRVVARISYPLTPTKKLEFDADFERINNDLKIVRVRDTKNRLIVGDPDINNYLNRRFSLPDGSKGDDLATTEEIEFLSISQLRNIVAAALADHNSQRIKELAQTFIDSDPDGGEGYGLRAGANQLLGNYEEAEKDAGRALQHGASVYLTAQRHGAWSTEPFTPVVLAISKSKIEYRPAPGRGSVEEIAMNSVTAKFDGSGKISLKGILKGGSRPFLALTFKGNDGKNKTYNFAALGTVCPGQAKQDANLVQVPGGGTCGTQSTQVPTGRSIPVFDPSAKDMPLLVPPRWQQDLTVILRSIEAAHNSPGK